MRRGTLRLFIVKDASVSYDVNIGGSIRGGPNGGTEDLVTMVTTKMGLSTSLVAPTSLIIINTCRNCDFMILGSNFALPLT